MTGGAVTIKGTSDGLIISLGEGPLNAILAEMEARLSSRASFFLGGRVALDTGDRPLAVEQLVTIGSILEGIGVTLWAVEGEHPTTMAAAQELGLETSIRPKGGLVPEAPERISREEMTGIVIRRTLRSGQAIHHTGHITLIGDLNPGAEAVAAGDIVVWGTLRGTVHAGAMGDEEAMVCALKLAPSQIRIGSRIARSPERSRPPSTPEIAYVHDGRIVVDRWNEGKQLETGFGGWTPLRGCRASIGIREWQQRLKVLLGNR